MKNNRKGRVVTIIIIIGIVLVGGGVYVYSKNRSSTSADTQETLKTNQEKNSNCVNTKYGYELEYPSDWKVWASERAEERPATCAENFKAYIFAKDLVKTPTVNKIGLTVYASGDERVGTFWQGVNSLDTYVNKLPAVAKKQVTLDTERAVLVTYDQGGDGLISYHNGSFYVFTVDSVERGTLEKFLSSFRFTK